MFLRQTCAVHVDVETVSQVGLYETARAYHQTYVTVCIQFLAFLHRLQVKAHRQNIARCCGFQCG